MLNFGGEKYKNRETSAEVIVPTTSAPYEPLNSSITITRRNRSRDASAYLARSNFHLMKAILKKVTIPIIKNSIKTPLVSILEHSSECSDMLICLLQLDR